jgi:hypothetical protein
MFRGNKLPWIVGAALVVLLAAGAIVIGGKKKESEIPPPPPESGRAVVVPANVTRTVVVPPCGTPIQQTVTSAEKNQSVPGATVFELPKGNDVRTLLVPHCKPKTGATTLQGVLPSAAFVIPGNARTFEGNRGRLEAFGVVAESQLLLTEGSRVATLVVPACTKEEKGARDVVLEAEQGKPELAVGPKC